MIWAPVRWLGMSFSLPCRGSISQIDSRSDTITRTNRPDTHHRAGPILELIWSTGGIEMKTQWMAVAVLSAAFAAGCGEKSAENPQEGPPNEGTTVAVPQDPGTQANLQPAPADVSPNRDAPGTAS